MEEQTEPILLRVPKSLLKKIELEAEKESRNRQNYILKVLKEELA